MKLAWSREKWMSKYGTFLATLFAVGGLWLGTVYAANQPEWLTGQLKKPLDQVHIAFSMKGVKGGDVYTVQMLQTMRDEAAKYGVHFDVFDAQDDPVKQSQEIPNIIAQQPDVIAVWAINPKSIVPAVKKIHDAGIPIVTFDSPIDEVGEQWVTAFAGPDQYGQGKVAAEALVKALGGKGNVVEIRSQYGFKPSDLRAQAWDDVAKKAPQIRTLDIQAGMWSQVLGQNIMEQFITRFGKQIDGVISCDGYTGTGAYLAVKSAVDAGQLDAGHIKFSDGNMVSTIYDLIKEGKYDYSVQQSPQVQGAFQFKVALQVAEGMQVPRENMMPTPLISKDNLDKFERPTN
jgi:ribose transport system substrate-binding protein